MMIDKTERRPLIDPLLLAMKSRRVLIAIAALLVSLLVLAIPELGAARAELLTLVITLALALIGGYSVEDAARIARDRSAGPPDGAITVTPEELRTLIKEAIAGLIDEIGAAHERQNGAA